MASWRWLGSGVLAVAATATCAGHLPPCPAAGGPVWTELQSPHFRLRTDQPPADAHAVLTGLEQLRAALLTIFGAPADLDTGHVPVVVVERGWTDFAPRQVEGFFTHALFQPLVVMSAGGQLHREEVIKHELVHYFASKVMTRQPRWLAEGLATYYQTIDYDQQEGQIRVGQPPLSILSTAQRASVANIEAALRATSVGEDAGRFYASSWITVHYLMNHRQAALEGFEKALRAGASFEAAWTAAFGAQTPAQLAVDVRHYIDGGRYHVLVYRFPTLTLTPPNQRPLDDAETHATRALLLLAGRGSRARAPELSVAEEDPSVVASRELGEALRAQPSHVASLAITHWMLKVPVGVDRAKGAIREHAGDWLAWLLLAEALEHHPDRAERDEALAEAIALARLDRSIEIPADDPP